MNKTPTVIVVVGIFFIVGVILLFGFSLRATGPSLRGGYVLYAEVDDSKGLERGAEVTRAGVPVGTVESIELADAEENKVRIKMRIFKQAVVRQDAVASIQLRSLLGTYFIHLSHGAAGSPAASDQTVLQSEEIVDVNAVMRVVASLGDKVGGLVGGAEELISSVDENQKTFFIKVNGLIDENRENVKTVSEAFAKAAPKVEGFFDSVSELTTALNEGEGTIGKLFKDDAVYQSIRTATSNLEEISGRMKTGEGALGKLIYDEELANQLDETFKNVNTASTALREALDANSKDLNELINSLKKMTPNVQEAFDNFLEVSRKVNSDAGTLGKLINDPQLYDEARSAVTQIRKTFEEGEEQSVLRTFLGVFFGSMI
ncbi:MAG TPA: MlaD family protein [Sumerlaeia bacterium]|nr:MlaD family protein [Sumerlaeia bacterium]